MGIPHGAGAGARDQADPRQLRRGRVGTGAGRAGHEPREPGRLLQASPRRGAAVSTREERLAELGLSVPEVPKPVAAYIPAVRSGDHVYTSGQLPMRDGQLLLAGKVGGEVTAEEAVECARQCALNAIAAVRAEIGDLSAVKRIVKVVAFVASTPDFTGQ